MYVLFIYLINYLSVINNNNNILFFNLCIHELHFYSLFFCVSVFPFPYTNKVAVDQVFHPPYLYPLAD